MRRLGWSALALSLAACGGSDPVGLELEITRDGCDGEACTVTARGSGLLVRAEPTAGAPDGPLTLYGEAALGGAKTAIVEVSFLGAGARARYREVQNGQARFQGRISRLEASPPSHDGVSPVAGHFSFVAEYDGLIRHVRGVILPVSDEAVRVSPESEAYVPSPTTTGCGGEVYLPPPSSEPGPLPDDPWLPEPEPEPGTSPGTSPEPDPWTDPDDLPDDGWSPPPPEDPGCDGDSYDEYEEPDTMAADSGCEGDSYEDEDYDMESDSGCEGDEYDGYEMSALLPVMGSMWRLGWPLGLAGFFNRRSRRRSARSRPEPR